MIQTSNVEMFILSNVKIVSVLTRFYGLKLSNLLNLSFRNNKDIIRCAIFKYFGRFRFFYAL